MARKILIICTGNSCRSQMAEGIFKIIAPEYEVYSAGTKPEKEVNPNAVIVMREINIDISRNKPKHINGFVNESFDTVITVCDNAKGACPVFMGKVNSRVHIGFEDPADARGTDEEILAAYRKTRDEIYLAFSKFYNESAK